MSTKLSVNDFLTIVDAFIQPEINAKNSDNYALAKQRMSIVFEKLLREDDPLVVTRENLPEQIQLQIHALKIAAKEILAIHNVENNQLHGLVKKRTQIQDLLNQTAQNFNELLTQISEKC